MAKAWRSICFTRTRPFVEDTACGCYHFTRSKANRAAAIGDQLISRCAMQMDASQQRRHRWPALGKQGGDYAGQHIAHAGGGHAGVAAGT